MAEAKSNSFIETEHEVLKFWEEMIATTKEKQRTKARKDSVL